LQKAVDIAIGMRDMSIISDMLQVLLYRMYICSNVI